MTFSITVRGALFSWAFMVSIMCSGKRLHRQLTTNTSFEAETGRNGVKILSPVSSYLLFRILIGSLPTRVHPCNCCCLCVFVVDHGRLSAWLFFWGRTCNLRPSLLLQVTFRAALSFVLLQIPVRLGLVVLAEHLARSCC